ncbi:TPM domain-containing protein, partial [Candidatus Falkowbacteria bacterium]|nr:TPM domain-containing protein [Candidatus Falkowbacteria bacterium]
MKKIIIILLLFFAWPVLAYYNPGQPSGFVNDYTNTLTLEQRQALENKLSNFEKETSNEIAVVLINGLEDDTIENFAIKLFEDWKIGKQSNDNGVLVLVAKNDREMRIEVGYGLEGALTDAQSNWIINQIMKPAFRANDFYGGLDGAVDKIMAATKGEYVPSDSQNSNGGKSSFNPEFIFYMVVFGFIWLASILGRSKSWWAGGIIG